MNTEEKKLLDDFAGQALNAFLSSPASFQMALGEEGDTQGEQIASMCYGFAKSMLKVRKKLLQVSDAETVD